MTQTGPNIAGPVVGTSGGVPGAGEAGSPKKVDLVLQGGGVKGIGLVGAISVLEEKGYQFQRVAGASAGAIVGSLVAAGMSADKLHDIIATLDYTRFKDETRLDHIPGVGKGLSLWFKHGLYAGDYFHQWIGEQLGTLGVQTFAQLYSPDPGSSLPADQQYKLVVVASDVTRGNLLRLPWDYSTFHLPSDSQRVADAVRSSMSIPFFYRPVELDFPGAAPSVLVDGGMLSNFPVDVFDRTDGKPPRWPTIGIKLSAKQQPDAIEHHVEGDISLAMAMLGTMQSWNDQMHLDDPGVIGRTIFVDTLGVNTTDFGITRAMQDALFESGRAAATRFIASQTH